LLRLARLPGSRSSLTATCCAHSCGYKLANDGQDTRAIQHYLGHRSIASTVRYTALAPDRFKPFSGRTSVLKIALVRASPSLLYVTQCTRRVGALDETLSREQLHEPRSMANALTAVNSATIRIGGGGGMTSSSIP
jgi:hypothetical protein